MKRALIAVLLTLGLPAPARAEPATLVTRDLPSPGARSLAAASPRFNLVGLHWRGTGSVSFRTRGLDGRWSGWRPAAPEDEDRPDRGSGETSRPGWRLGNPWWTGPSDRIEVRSHGAVRRVRAFYVWSPVESVPTRTTALVGSPAIVPRLSWGANEAIKRAPPRFAPALQLAVVHHTAGRSGYTRAESAAVVKAIQLYHVQGNGWNDIGYNFLVDRFGQVFEGRFGGLDRNVIGAHAEGFNTGSVGVAVLGTYGSALPSAAARAAVARLVAWRLDLAHIDPLSSLTYISGGNARFPAGIPVFLQAVAGHRDTGFTTCPGNAFYARLGELARTAEATGLPKLYESAVRGRLGGPIRFTGRLSSPLPWTVTVTDSSGLVAASGVGTGTVVDWSWDSAPAAAGAYSYAMEAGPEVLPASGKLGSKSAVLAISDARADPAAVSPNGDGLEDSTTVSYTLSAPATVTATLVDAAGTTLTTLFVESKLAGAQSFLFTPESVPDGTYTIVLSAADAAGRAVVARVPLVISRVLSGLAATRRVFSPNGDGRADRIAFVFGLAETAEVRLRAFREGVWVATPFAGPLGPGSQSLEWDGSKRLGRLRDGDYEAELTVTTAAGSVTQRIPFASDTTAPTLRLLSVRPLRLRVSEPGTVVLVINGAARKVGREAAGVLTVPLRTAPKRLRAVAWDAAGNVSAPVRAP